MSDSFDINIRIIDSGFGLIEVPLSVLVLWDKYGWPSEDALREMVKSGKAWIEQG